MKILYFDCSYGIAGDMILSAIMNTGIITPAAFERRIKYLLPQTKQWWEFKINSVERNHLPATMTQVIGDKKFNSPLEIKDIIKKSNLSPMIKNKSIQILDTLILAEAHVHKTKPEKVHFDEMSCIDTLIDITGAVIGLDLLRTEKIYSSFINTGSGAAPATVLILRDKKVPVYSKSKPGIELTTPTGAAIISNIADKFIDNMPEMKIDKFGFGAGTRNDGSPNLLRLYTGKTIGETGIALDLAGLNTDNVILLETNIDDMDPRIYPYIMDKLLKQGCLDVWLTQVLMKKGRPGIILNSLTSIQNEPAIVNTIFKETTTIGIRRIPVSRYKLPREQKGKYKISRLPDGTKKISVEYDSAVKYISNKSRNIRKVPPLRKFL